MKEQQYRERWNVGLAQLPKREIRQECPGEFNILANNS
jgi:hypothetical protein